MPLAMLSLQYLPKGKCNVFKKTTILWIKTIHYPNILRSHLVTIVLMASFTLNQLQS